MAILAVALIVEIAPEEGPTFFATIHFAPTGGAVYTGERAFYVNGLAANITSLAFSAAIEAAVKAKMEADGVTFGLLDTVRVIPSAL